MKYFAFRISAMGDVAMCVPVLVQVLEQNPHVHLYFATHPAWFAMFPKHERLHLIAFHKKEAQRGIFGLLRFIRRLPIDDFHAFLDLHQIPRSQIISLAFQLRKKPVYKLDKQRSERKRLIEEKSIDQPLIPMIEKYAQVFRDAGNTLILAHKRTDFLKLNSPKQPKSIGIAPFAKHFVKQFPLESMREVVTLLAENEIEISVYGSPVELDQIQSWDELKHVQLIASGGLEAELKQMASHQCMLTMDSANMHLASLVGTRVFSIWGSTHPSAGFLGYGQSLDDVIHREDLFCRPCSIYGNVDCYRKDLACLNGLHPEEIARRLLDSLIY